MLHFDIESAVPVLRSFPLKSLRSSKRYMFVLALLANSGVLCAQESPSDLDVSDLVSAPLTAIDGAEIELVPPSQVTLRDAEAEKELTPDERIARRPWLLDKLTGGDREESVKMDPPEPPRNGPPGEDPPSLHRIGPPNMVGDLDPDDGWMQRESDRRAHLEEAPSKRLKPRPLTDVGIEDARKLEPSERLTSPTDEPVEVANPRAVATRSRESAARQLQPRETQPREKVSEELAQEPSANLDYIGFPQQEIRLKRSVYQMRSSMYRTLRSYHSDREIAQSRSNWGMMHAMMVYGVDTQVRVGRKTYSTIAWIAGNNACRGQRLLEEDDRGIAVKSGVGLQGHQAQFLAVLSLCNVPADYPLYAGEGQYTVQDVIEVEKRDCKSGEELTFTLIGLSHYMDTEASWIAEDGEEWDFERLIREELSQPVVGAACGGTHRLMGFAHALRNRRMEGRPITGQWARAEKFMQDFIQYAYRLQNRDGSMSTDWFEGREDNGDMDRKIQTTGHIVEWLLTVTPDSELQNPRLVSAVRYLLNTMSEERKHDWSIGPKGHALRSLAIYYDRVYKAAPPWRNTGVATRKRTNRR